MREVGAHIEKAIYRTQLAPLPTVDEVLHHRFANQYLLIHSFRGRGGWKNEGPEHIRSHRKA